MEIGEIYNSYAEDYNKSKVKSSYIANLMTIIDALVKREDELVESLNSCLISCILLLREAEINIEGNVLNKVNKIIFDDIENLKETRKFPNIVENTSFDDLVYFGDEYLDVIVAQFKSIENLMDESERKERLTFLIRLATEREQYENEFELYYEIYLHRLFVEIIIDRYFDERPLVIDKLEVDEYGNELKKKKGNELKKKSKRGRKPSENYPVDEVARLVHKFKEIKMYQEKKKSKTIYKKFAIARRVLDEFPDVEDPMTPEGMYKRVVKILSSTD